MYLYNNVNGDLANLINWFKANKLSLNIAKTNYILFPSSKFVNVGGNMKLYAGADEIIRNECCKFLGIIIDDKLGWLDHINSVNIKLSRSLYILNSVKNMLPNDILRQLYYTMVQPYLTYKARNSTCPLARDKWIFRRTTRLVIFVVRRTAGSVPR